MREGHGSNVAEEERSNVAKRSGLALPQLFLLLLWAVTDSSVIGSSSPPALLPSGMERTGLTAQTRAPLPWRQCCNFTALCDVFSSDSVVPQGCRGDSSRLNKNDQTKEEKLKHLL